MNKEKLNTKLLIASKFKIDENSNYSHKLIKEYDLFYFIHINGTLKIKKHLEILDKENLYLNNIFNYLNILFIYFKNLFSCTKILKKPIETIKLKIKKSKTIKEFIIKENKSFFKNINNKENVDITIYLVPRNKSTREVFYLLLKEIKLKNTSLNNKKVNLKNIAYIFPFFSILISAIFPFELRALGIPIEVFYENNSIVAIFLFLIAISISSFLLFFFFIIIIAEIFSFINNIAIIFSIFYFFNKKQLYYRLKVFLLNLYNDSKISLNSFIKFSIFVFVVPFLLILYFIAYDVVLYKFFSANNNFFSQNIYFFYQYYTGYPKFIKDIYGTKYIAVGQKGESEIVYEMEKVFNYISMTELKNLLTNGFDKNNIKENNKFIELSEQYKEFCFNIDYTKDIKKLSETKIIFEMIKKSDNNYLRDYSTIHSLNSTETLPFRLTTLNIFQNGNEEEILDIYKNNILNNCILVNKKE